MDPDLRKLRRKSEPTTPMLEDELNKLVNVYFQASLKLMDVREKHLVEEDKKLVEELGKMKENMLIIRDTLNERENQQGGKRSRKNKKSHKKRAKRTHAKRAHAKRAHAKRIRAKRARHTRKH